MSDGTDVRAPFSSFQEAVDFLEKAIDYEKRTRWKYSDELFDLRRMDALLAELGDPHRSFRVIHVAGTKGKGSTAALIEACLRQGGYRTGLHTSPHLASVCERMVACGRPAKEADFCRLLGLLRGYIHRRRLEARDEAPTYFETTTALSFKHFQEQKVDWAVVEVGLGGRLDSTNVVSPECCVITPIGLDHTDKLGDTPGMIAGEKAGIIKPGARVVLARQGYPEALAVLRGRADAMGCPRWEVGGEVRVTEKSPLVAPPEDAHAPVGWLFSVETPLRSHPRLFTPLLGAHQVENCATAIAAIDTLVEAGRLLVEPEAVARGVAACRWPARVELLGREPLLVLDSAHTVESVRALMDALATHLPRRPLQVVFGCSADKNYGGMIELVAPRCAGLIATQADSPRALPADEICRAARQAGIGSVRAVVGAPQAVRECLQGAGARDVVCVTGSFFVAGEVRTEWEQSGLT